METPLTQNITSDRQPPDIKQYQQAGGYQALRKVIKEMTPQEVQETIKDSKLRGRGGAGFPTGMKWSFIPMGEDAPHPKYLVANADEMEPGTFKDRLLMEGDPHQLIEGMVVSSYATQVDVAYIFLRDEYKLPAHRLKKAIREAQDQGFLGKNILGSNFSLEFHIHTSAGRYICGEETALVTALEGKRAIPRQKPPYPQVCGLWGKPTVINNVETFCNVPHIVNHGAEWYRNLSRGEDGGTKLYGASGRVKRPGCWELPMGTTIREILEEHAGGMREGYRFRGLLPGGASTDFLVEEHLDVPMDFDSVMKAGSRMGTGGMIILDDKTCPVGMLLNLERFFAQESCGWCTPCRDGLPWVAKILQAIEEGRGKPEDLEVLEMHTQFLGPGKTFCMHAPGAMEPLQSALKYFREDFERHIREQRCPLEELMAIIHIDDQAYEVDARHNLLQACLSLGFDLPYFCWHPAMGSVGACRQCAVKQFKDENDKQGKIVVSCMTAAQDGARISIEDSQVRAFRASVIEWLMANHPHDCPVCEEGGECHLQDMTLLTGHTYRRYRFKKRTFRNQYLGPFVKHEMNRCIACYRCVRFYRDYAGGHDLNVFATHNHVFFGRHEDGVLENEFSGNLVEVCPTGVFTDKTLSERYSRKWDLQTAPSVCVHCGLGCNTSPGERYGELRRIQNRYNSQINGYFLCDRGRFGYDFVNSEQRVRQPLLRRGDQETAEPVSKEEVIQHLASLLSKNVGKVIGIGSPRASIEANFALRTLVGPENFYAGMSAREHQLIAAILAILREGPAGPASLHDAEQADAVLVLGEDLTNTAPRLALTLRQAVRHRAFEIADQQKIPRWQDSSVRDAAQHQKSPLFMATLAATRLDDIAAETYHGTPDDLARLGFAVAHALNPQAPAVQDLAPEVGDLARRIAQTLKGAKRPLVVSGTGCLSESLIQAAANVAWALCSDGHPADLLFTVPECNSLGLGLMGGQSLDAAFKPIQQGNADTVIVLENNLYRRTDWSSLDALLNNAGHVIVIDHLLGDTATSAEAVLPAATFAEGDGTLVNNEGRAQRSFQVYAPNEDIQESWRWLRDLMQAAGRSEADAWQQLDDVTAACAATLPVLEGIQQAAPRARFRIAGMKIAREPHRYSGRTAMNANISVHEPKPPADPDSPLSFSMEGYHGQAPGALIPYFWAPSWNSIQSVNKFQEEVGGPLRGGEPGRRLIEPNPEAQASYFSVIPPAFQPRNDRWLIVPFYHIFGTEELSALAPAVDERVPKPYVALNSEDAKRLQIGPGEVVELEVGGITHRLPVQVREGDTIQLMIAGTMHRLPAQALSGKSMELAVMVGTTFHLPMMLRPDLPPGMAGLPIGLPGLKGIDLPTTGKIARIERS